MFGSPFVRYTTSVSPVACRRGSAASVTLTFNSWRPYNEGALALRYTFETGRLDVLYLTPTAAERHPTGALCAYFTRGVAQYACQLTRALECYMHQLKSYCSFPPMQTFTSLQRTKGSTVS